MAGEVVSGKTACPLLFIPCIELEQAHQGTVLGGSVFPVEWYNLMVFKALPVLALQSEIEIW